MAEKRPKGKDSDGLAKAVIRLLTPFIGHIRSITTVNGGEFAAHKAIAKRLKTTVFFAHPYSAWEKDANENFNKLLRQYIPKKPDFNDFQQQDIMTLSERYQRKAKRKT